MKRNLYGRTSGSSGAAALEGTAAAMTQQGAAAKVLPATAAVSASPKVDSRAPAAACKLHSAATTAADVEGFGCDVEVVTVSSCSCCGSVKHSVCATRYRGINSDSVTCQQQEREGSTNSSDDTHAAVDSTDSSSSSNGGCPSASGVADAGLDSSFRAAASPGQSAPASPVISGPAAAAVDAVTPILSASNVEQQEQQQQPSDVAGGASSPSQTQQQQQQQVVPCDVWQLYFELCWEKRIAQVNATASGVSSNCIPNSCFATQLLVCP